MMNELQNKSLLNNNRGTSTSGYYKDIGKAF